MVLACHTSTIAPATGLPVRVPDLAFHEQHLALLGVLVEPRLALRERRAGDVERALDGARRAALQPGTALLLVHHQVEEGLDAETGDEQADLVRLAEPRQVAHRRPELGRRDVELLDGRHMSVATRWTMRFSRSLPPAWSSPATRFSSCCTSGVLVSESDIRFLRPALCRDSVSCRMRSGRRWSAEIAARHGQGHAGDVGGIVGGEEQDRRRLLLRRAVSLHQAGGDGLVHDLLVPGLLLLASAGRRCAGCAAAALPCRRARSRSPGCLVRHIRRRGRR